MPKLCVFDLDGTLCYTMPDILDSLNAALLQNGYPAVSEASLRTYVSVGGANIIRCAVGEEQLTKELFTAMCSSFYREYAKRLCEKTRPYPGIIEGIKTLKQQGILCGVLTNKEDEFAKEIVDTLFPKGLFHFIVGLKPEYPAKPDPTILNILLSAYDTTKEECIFIGDSEVDALLARNAGVNLCGVAWGYSPEALRAANPEFWAVNADELPDVLTKGKVDAETVCV